MTTNEVKPNSELNGEPTLKKDRDIGTLLSLDTYQGMSDSEIESIIKFKTQLAVKEELVRTSQAAYIEEMNVLSEQYKNMAKEASAVYKTVLGLPLNLVSVDGGKHE